MNEKFDLVKILKNCPEGTELYSTIYGYVTFCLIEANNGNYQIKIEHTSGYDWFTRDGRWNEAFDGECVLFPSKDQRDWSKFKLPNEDVDPDDSNKREVKYRPFKDLEECFKEMKKHSPFGWICNVNDGYNLIVFLNDDTILFDGSWVSYPEALKRGYTFMDGSPFGIKEE